MSNTTAMAQLPPQPPITVAPLSAHPFCETELPEILPPPFTFPPQRSTKTALTKPRTGTGIKKTH